MYKNMFGAVCMCVRIYFNKNMYTIIYVCYEPTGGYIEGIQILNYDKI